jgi:hypothetical protein
MNTPITKEKREELAAKIEPLRQEVQSWRASRKQQEPMPEPLWEKATELARAYGVSPVQRALRIDYRGLEFRALGIRKPAAKASSPKPARPAFVELPVGSLSPPRRTEQTIELEDGTGRKMTLKVCGTNLSEVITLAQAFWRPSA